MDVPSQMEKKVECEIRADTEKYYRRPTYYDDDEEDEFDVNSLSLSSHS